MNNHLARLIGMKRKSGGEIFAEWLITAALGTFGAGWEFMLAVGVVHHEWLHGLPTIGYWWATLVVFLLRGLFSRFPKIERYKDPS